MTNNNVRAWLCELAQEDGTTRTQIVEQDPAGLRWNDAGEPSPYRVTPLHDLTGLPVAIMDTRDALGLCAPTEADFQALYELRGRRVALVDLGPCKATHAPAA